jgi:hypothetical protein
MCDRPTGHGGGEDDSLYLSDGPGPLCDDCWERYERGGWKQTSQLERQLAQRTAERDAEKARREKVEAEVERLRILEAAVRAYRAVCIDVGIGSAEMRNLQLAGQAVDAALDAIEAAREKP